MRATVGRIGGLVARAAARRDRGDRPRAARRPWAALLLALLSPGCITVGGGGDEVPERRHVLEVGGAAARPEGGARGGASATVAPADARPAADAASQGAAVVAVRPFRAAERIGRHVLRREGPSRVSELAGELWADEPAQAFTDAAREALASDGRFAAAVDAASGARADVVLDGVVLDCCVEASSGGNLRAVVRLRLTWTSSPAGEVFGSSAVDGSEDVPGPGTDGLGAAMGRAVARAVRAGVPPGFVQAPAPAGR